MGMFLHQPSSSAVTIYSTQILAVSLTQVRALAAAVLSSMLEGPAQKAYLMIAEAKSAARPPVR